MNTGYVHYVVIITLVAIFFTALIYLFSPFFTPLVLGVVFAALTNPWYEWLTIKLKGRQGLAALIVVFAVIFLIIGPVSSLITILSKEGYHLFVIARDQVITTNFDEFIKSNNLIARGLRSVSDSFHVDVVAVIRDQAGPALKNLGLSLSDQLGNIFSNIIQVVIGFFIMAMTIYYLLRDGAALGDFLLRVSPLKTKEELYVFHTFREVTKAVFFGNFVSALAQGVLGGIGFWLFGLSTPVLWGVVMMMMAFIPLLGTPVVFLPAAMYLFVTGDFWTAIGFLAYNVIVVANIDNVIKPKLISNKIKVHPLLIFLVILGGISVFGIMGLIYGPMIMAVLLSLIDIYFVTQKEIDERK